MAWKDTTYAARDSGAETIPEIIEWANGAGIQHHDTFVDGVGAAMDILGARMEQILPRCEEGKLHDLYDMTFNGLEYRKCDTCGAEVRGDAHVRYQTLQRLMKQKYCDWQRETGQEVEFDQKGESGE